MVATRARSPGAAGRPGPPPVAAVWRLAVSRRSSLKQINGSKFNLLLMLVAQMSTCPTNSDQFQWLCPGAPLQIEVKGHLNANIMAWYCKGVDMGVK